LSVVVTQKGFDSRMSRSVCSVAGLRLQSCLRRQSELIILCHATIYVRVGDRVRVVGAHFVTIPLALNSTVRLNCQQKFNFWAALLNVRYVPSPYGATTVTQLWATEASPDAYKEEKLTSSLSLSTADHGVWPLDFNNKNR
jgi:hypothetical protein